jgi:hypothetical protein
MVTTVRASSPPITLEAYQCYHVTFRGSGLTVHYIGQRKKTMLWTIAVVFLVLWLLGFSLSIGGSLIHLLLVLAVVVVVINLLSGRRGAA